MSRDSLYSSNSNAVHDFLALAQLLLVLRFPNVRQLHHPPVPPSPLCSPFRLSTSVIPWLSRAKRVSSFTNNSLLPLSLRPSHLAPSPLSPSSCSAAHRRRACCRALTSTLRNSPSAALSRRYTHPRLLHVSSPSLPSSLHLFLDQKAMSPPDFSPLYTALLATTSTAPLCQPVLHQ